eukprot:9002000-Alexandrium_andersonii.AAC.1
MPERCLNDARTMPERCLDDAWAMPERYLNGARTVLERCLSGAILGASAPTGRGEDPSPPLAQGTEVGKEQCLNDA